MPPECLSLSCFLLLTHDNLILGFWREEEEVSADDDDLDLLRERGVGRAPNGQGVPIGFGDIGQVYLYGGK